MSFVLKQEAYEGPLDLLLQLIEKEELEITNLSLANVTEQYLEYVRELEHTNLSEVSEFLVIAARLILLKSRALLPTESVHELEPDDLAARLVEYKLYKRLAAQLGVQAEASLFSQGKEPSKIKPPEQLITDGVDRASLREAFERVLEHIPTKPDLPEGTVEEQITIEECIAAVQQRLAGGQQPFESMFDVARSRVGVIVTFLAILELVKQRSLTVTAGAEGFTLSLRI